MNALEFLQAPPIPRPLFAVFGEDAYLRREALGAIARTARTADETDADDIGISRFPGAQARLSEVLDEVRTLPFLADRRVVIVEEADPFVTANRKELESYAERPSSSGILVLSVKSWPSNTKLAKLVEKVGLAVECKAPRESELPAWLGKLSKQRWGIKLETDAARLLVELVGPEVGLLSSEVDKLASYIGDRPSIRRDDVARMVGSGRVEDVWKMLDAATLGQGGKALADLERLLHSGEHPVPILAGMSRSLMRISHAGRLRMARRDLRDACKEAGIPTFPANLERVGQQHAHLGPARVAGLPAKLLKADLDLKGASTLPPRVILERLLVELASPRKD
ncbi:DNA polymerase III subunit delta [soil metagenome]